MIASSVSEQDAPVCPLVRAARRRLHVAPYPSIRNVSCESGGAGTLVLRGQLPSFYLKQFAQEVVARTEGVMLVLNETEVS